MATDEKRKRTLLVGSTALGAKGSAGRGVGQAGGNGGRSSKERTLGPQSSAAVYELLSKRDPDELVDARTAGSKQ